jgi:hypothetical protein
MAKGCVGETFNGFSRHLKFATDELRQALEKG